MPLSSAAARVEAGDIFLTVICFSFFVGLDHPGFKPSNQVARLAKRGLMGPTSLGLLSLGAGCSLQDSIGIVNIVFSNIVFSENQTL